ncbi:MAG: 5-formyltetrahydrofolate cyclo-ligase [Deltaproteobacteria bacterium]|nr:5-formyltetrahydrofolate cyclo-ligase [Deltaproteobacteria bacterium]
MSDKQTLRVARWEALQTAGAARFPGTKGRIPNFVGAEKAAAQLAATELFQRARTIKCNPDSPQRPVRHAALKAGKTVIMAVPKLAERECFWRLDPATLDDLWKASSIKGAAAVAEPIREDAVGTIDLIVTGCVAVAEDGSRLGKGGGYSDLEYAVLRELALVDADTPIVTTVHSSQVLAPGTIPMDAHDISLDLYCTEVGLTRCERVFARPEGVDRSILEDDKLGEIPALVERFAAVGPPDR